MGYTLINVHFDFLIYFVFSSIYTVGDLSMGRQEAFEIFRRDNDRNQDIDENKRLLKEKYREAKMLGETVNQSRSKISE